MAIKQRGTAKSIAFALLVLVVLSLSVMASAKVSRGTLKTKHNFVLLSRFGVSTAGTARVLFGSSDMKPADDAEKNMLLSFYNDQKDEDWYWKNVNNDKESEQSCLDKVNDQHYEDIQAHVNGTSWEFPISNTHSPHSWWLAVSDCPKSSDEEFEMKFDIHWINSGNGWYREFSLEDQDLLTIYLIFFLFWIVVASVFFILFLKKILEKKSPNFEFRILFCSMIVVVFSLLFYLIHYSVYAADGRGVLWILGIAETLDMIQTLMLMTVIFLFLKGRNERTIVDIGIVGLFLFFYFSFFWWQMPETILESIDEKYKWQVAPGIIMLCFRCLFFGFLAAILTIKAKNESNSYRRIVIFVLFLAILFYFLTLPFTVCLMTGASFFYRWKTVLAVSLSIDLITYLFFGLLLVESPLAKLLNPIQLYNPVVKRADDDEDGNNPYGSL